MGTPECSALWENPGNKASSFVRDDCLTQSVGSSAEQNLGYKRVKVGAAEGRACDCVCELRQGLREVPCQGCRRNEQPPGPKHIGGIGCFPR